MRNKIQVAKRERRAAIANNLLTYIKAVTDGDFFKPPTYPIVDVFAREKGYDLFEAWKAWDLILESGRLTKMYMPWGYRIPRDMPVIELDSNGGIIWTDEAKAALSKHS